MITKKTFPIGTIEIRDNQQIYVVKKTVSEYRIFGILILRKEIVSPNAYARYHTEFYANF